MLSLAAYCTITFPFSSGHSLNDTTLLEICSLQGIRLRYLRNVSVAYLLRLLVNRPPSWRANRASILWGLKAFFGPAAVKVTAVGRTRVRFRWYP
jgi:hypothetical protein